MSETIIAVKGDASQTNIGITKVTFDRLLKHEKFVELFALYGFYCYTSRWQRTDCVKCTDSYVAKALNRSREHVQRTRKILEELMLIKLIKKKNPDTNQIEGFYIRVFHLVEASVIVDHVQCDPKPDMAQDHTNALRTGSLNAEELVQPSPQDLNLKIEKAGKHPTIEEVKSFASSLKLPESDGEDAWHRWEASGWKRGKQPIVKWKSAFHTLRLNGWLPSQNQNKPKKKDPFELTI